MENSYEIFIEKERASASEFCNKMQIYDGRFINAEYVLVERIFSYVDIINNIYSVIDDLIRMAKLRYDDRYLIIGDFLFAATSWEMSDPSNLIFKFSRDSYFSRIRLRGRINECFNYNYERYIRLHQKLLIGLMIEGVITRMVISRQDVEWCTVIYFSFNIEDVSIKWTCSVFLARSPFVIINMGNSILFGSFRNILLLKRKKDTMEDYEISHNSIIKANQISYALDGSLYEINKKHLTKLENDMLERQKCSNIDEYFSKMNKILGDVKYTRRLIKRNDVIDGVTYDDISKLGTEVFKEYVKVFSDFQHFITLHLLKGEIYNKKFYLPCFYDNRGRQYYGAQFSPTFNVLFRYLYKFSDKKKFVDLENSMFYNKLMKYVYCVKEYGLNDLNSYILLVLFIEVGKFFIKNGEDYCFSTSLIIMSGIKNYGNRNICMDFKDLLYIEKIYNLIDKVLNNVEIDINTVIFKDATASGLQNYGVLLGYKEGKLGILNLDGDDWNDTYTFIIKEFLKETAIIERKRKYFKPTIMTIPYNATWYSCFISFLGMLRSDGIEYVNMSVGDREIIKKLHKDFYNSLQKNLKGMFFKNTVLNNILFRYNKETDIHIKEYKVTYKKKRHKYTTKTSQWVDDNDATMRANEANTVHHLDWLLVEFVSRECEVLSIHDCFGSRLCDLHRVMDRVNLYYSGKIGKKSYGLHIII